LGLLEADIVPVANLFQETGFVALVFWTEIYPTRLITLITGISGTVQN